MKVSDNPLLRVLAVVVIAAVGIRLVFELLEPVWPYLLITVVTLALLWAHLWWQRRW